MKRSILLSLALALFSLSEVGCQITINPATKMMQDKYNRTVIFHGVNVVYKVPPYVPSYNGFNPELSLADADIDNLVKWGFNFVRLGVMWEAVERSPG